MPVIKVNNASVHIQELNKGAKETILLIHGMFSNLSVYYFNIAPILAKNFHVVMYDMKSHGMSARSENGYDLNTMTDDLLALMETLNLKSVHLAGYSYGGLIALKMAMRYPGRVKKLAIIEAPDPSDEETLNNVIDVYSKEALEEYIHNVADKRVGRRQLDKSHKMYEYMFNETTIRSDMNSERDFFSSISHLSQDTLLVYGNGSNCADSGRKLYDKITRSKLLFLDGDHNLPLQQPEAIANRLKDFFEGWQIKIKHINSRLWQGLRS